MHLLSLTGKQWALRTPQAPSGIDAVRALRAQHGIVDAQIDLARFRPSMSDVALDMLATAMRKKRTIGIFGDYDCDGITASLELLRFLRRRGAEPVLRLPHRARDGYGLQVSTVRSLRESGVDLLVTVDNGIVAADAVAEARKLGMDVLIIDHHRMPSSRPDANVIVHPDDVPALADAPPCAAGLMYLLLRAWEGPSWTGQEEDVALAAIGTVADLVTLRGYNRWLVREGLAALPNLHACPLRELAQSVSAGGPLTCQDIGFRIAPRINAAGRMADPMIALEALLHGGERLRALDALNRERQEVTEALLQEALEDLRAKQREGDLCLCIASERFPAGIVGLLAGKLTDRFGRPALVGSIQGSVCTASLRSPACYDITAGLGRIAPLLHGYGGHAQAAGCTFAQEQFDVVQDALCRDVAASVDPASLRPTLWLDGRLDERDVTTALLEDIETLAPHGQGNPEPVFLMEGVRLHGTRAVGKDASHMQTNIGRARCIAFRMGHLLPLLTGDVSVDVACRITRDGWRGDGSAQVQIADIRLAVSRPVATVARE